MTAAENSVLIVGGGPAGLATAIAAAQRGLEVRIVDRSRPPFDKPCGEGLMPAAVQALAELGVQIPEAVGRPFRGICYHGDGLSVRADFSHLSGIAVRRLELHALLCERAAALGVRCDWQTTVRGLGNGHLRTDAGELTARWIIGADGLHSRLRRWARLDAGSRGRPRFGVRRHYRIAPWNHDVEVHWGRACEAYVWGTAADEVGVALLWSGEKSNFDSLLERFPALDRRLAAAETTSRDRGAGPFDQRVRTPCRGQLALVGDAAGYRDPITGEGLGIAFQQALALAHCLAAGDLSPYPAAVRHITRRPYLLIRLLLLAEARPELRRRLLSMWSERPEFFASMLALHSDDRPLSALGWSGLGALIRALAGGLLRPTSRLR